jgi:hypothetical protein
MCPRPSLSDAISRCSIELSGFMALFPMNQADQARSEEEGNGFTAWLPTAVPLWTLSALLFRSGRTNIKPSRSEAFLARFQI